MPSQSIEIFDVPQNSDEWLKLRVGLPTTSNFQCLMAESADRRVRATYMKRIAGEIITGTPAETYRNAAMDRGHVMEDGLRKKYAFLHDVDAVRVGFIRNGRRGCSPDSLIGENGGLEIKTQIPELLIDTIDSGKFPNVHKAQTQGFLLVAERDWIDLVVGYDGMPHFEIRAYRDAGYIVKLSREIDEFNEEVDALVDRIKRYGAPHEPAMSQLRASVEAA